MADVKHDTKRSETQLIGEVRIAFPYHQEKRLKSAGGALLDKPRYDATILYPKLGPAESCPNYKRLSEMAMEAATKAWAGWPEGGKWPIADGDIPYPHKPKPGEKALTPEQIAERNKWRVGSWVVEVSTILEPGVKVSILNNGVMQDVPAQTVAGVQTYKSGDYGYVSMNAYSFQNKTWGVNFGYEGVAYTRPGELIGGGPRSSTQMFAGLPALAGGGGMTTAAPRPPGSPTGGALPLPPSPPQLPVTASPGMAPSAPAMAPMPTVSAASPSSPPLPPMPPMPTAAGAPPLPR